MDKKDYIIILMAVIIVAGVGAYALTSIDFSTEPETASYDFEAFTMNATAEAKFNRSTIPIDGGYEIISFKDNNTNITVAYTSIDDALTKLSMGFVNEQNAKNYKEIPSNGTVLNGVTLYEIQSSKDNRTRYMATYETQTLFVQVSAETLDELIQMVNSIKIKETGIDKVNGTEETTSTSNNQQTQQTTQSSNNQEESVNEYGYTTGGQSEANRKAMEAGITPESNPGVWVDGNYIGA